MKAGDVAVTAEHLGAEEIERILAERQAAADADGDGGASDLAAVLRWTLGGERYAIPLSDIGEVADVPHLAAVPGAPPQLLGVVAWRGEVLNLFDPGPALGLATGQDDDAKMLVLRRDAPRLALRVSDVDAVALLPAAMLAQDDLARLVEHEAERFSLLSTERLVERLLPRRTQREG